MNSGQSDESAAPTRGEPSSEPPTEWFERAYANSPVASLICNDRGRIVYHNEAARQLLGARPPRQLSKLGELDAGCDTISLVSLLEETLEHRRQPARLQGALTGTDSTTVTVEFIPLPAPSPLAVCRLRPPPVIDRETRTRLLSQLADVRRQHRDLEAAGCHLVETIHRHLNAPVVCNWCEQGGRTTSWSAGDEEHCQRMANSELPDANEPDTELVELDDETATTILPLQIDDDTTAKLMVATRTGGRRIQGSISFWNCLASTAEATLQTAKLFESNRRERQRLRAVIEQMPMAVLLFDPDGAILDLNLRARGLAGRRDWDHLIDSDPPYDVYSSEGESLPRQQWPLIRALHSGDLCDDEEFILDFGDRQRTITVTVEPIRADDGQITSYMATARDITQRTEDERRRDEFLSVASHELRNPLTPLSGLVELALEQRESDLPVDPELLERAEAQVRRLERLVDGLLDVSRLESGTLPIRRRDTDMTTLVEEIIAPWLEGQYAGRFDLRLPDRPIRANVDPDRIDQVLTNIVDNAIKHGRDEGPIEIELFRNEESDEVVVVVRNPGDGIPDALLDRVFERHVISPDDSSSGAGLGLYIARQIVEDHGGEISIATTDDETTEVLVRLPSTS